MLLTSIAIPGVVVIELFAFGELLEAVIERDGGTSLTGSKWERNGREDVEFDAFTGTVRAGQVTPVQALAMVNNDTVVPE